MLGVSMNRKGLEELRGRRFGRLVVERVLLKLPGEKRRAQVRCDCGEQRQVTITNLRSGNTTSCGCYRRQRVQEAVTRHGMTKDGKRDPTYEAWSTMVRNCSTPSSGAWVNYGGIGIGVCERWLGDGGFERFLQDMGRKPEGHELSRRNKEENFTPENSYWATRRQVRRNTRSTTLYTVGGRTQCLVDWAREHDIPKSTLHYRVVTRGMSMRDALDVGRGRNGKVLL
jgi:hypothetical protein